MAGEISLADQFGHGVIQMRVGLESASWGSAERLEFMVLMIHSYSHLEESHAMQLRICIFVDIRGCSS